MKTSLCNDSWMKEKNLSYTKFVFLTKINLNSAWGGEMPKLVPWLWVFHAHGYSQICNLRKLIEYSKVEAPPLLILCVNLD